ncbi:MAG: molybdenum cofactor biosynthesis protein MoaE [Chitinophagaceae bacterium]
MTPSLLSHQAAVDNVFPVSEQPLDIAGLLAGTHHPRAGAIVLFSGEVRNHSNGKAVQYLEYEAHSSMASAMILKIIAEARSRWDLNIALAQHRLGKVAIGESAVVVITASAHRSEAYAANRFIIDRIKHEVPIWKCEYFIDGTSEWGGNCNCHTITGDTGKHVYD